MPHRGPPTYTCAAACSNQTCALEVSTYRNMENAPMAKYRVVALTAVVLLFASLFASRLMAAEMNGVMMKDGKMMMMMDGKATGPMEHEMTMSDGSKVMTDGMVKMKDGKEMHMKDGMMMMMDGKMMEGGKAMEMKK